MGWVVLFSVHTISFCSLLYVTDLYYIANITWKCFSVLDHHTKVYCLFSQINFIVLHIWRNLFLTVNNAEFKLKTQILKFWK